jgi:hypothetical protein
MESYRTEDAAFNRWTNSLLLACLSEILSGNGPRQTAGRLAGEPCIDRGKGGNRRQATREPQYLNSGGAGLIVEIAVELECLVFPAQVGF